MNSLTRAKLGLGGQEFPQEKKIISMRMGLRDKLRPTRTNFNENLPTTCKDLGYARYYLNQGRKAMLKDQFRANKTS